MDCMFEGCDKPLRSPGAKMCEGHYMQSYRGQELRPLRPRRVEGDECLAEGCSSKRRGQWCAMHEARLLRHGSLDRVIPPEERALRRGEAHPNWVDEPTYQLAHSRLKRRLGPASAHRCTECDCAAAHWAYVGHREPEQRMPYSVVVEDYRPMCVRCHKRYDMQFLTVKQPKRRGSPWLDTAVSLHLSGETWAEIGRQVGIHPSHVSRKVRESIAAGQILDLYPI